MHRDRASEHIVAMFIKRFNKKVRLLAGEKELCEKPLRLDIPSGNSLARGACTASLMDDVD